MKDVRNETWPILGICQGIEVLGVIFGNDNINTLSEIVIYGESRPVHWEVQDIRNQSKMFRTFPDYLKDQMGTQGLALHAHSFAISYETYENTPSLKNDMIVTQTDILEENGKKIKFVNALESKNYPIFSSMYHPEY